MKYCFFLFNLLLINTLYAQTATVKGKITDSNQAAIEGVSIFLKNSSKGVVSDRKGNFEIKIAANQKSTLVFQHVQFNTYEITLNPRNAETIEQNISLQEKIRVLQDVELNEKRNNIRESPSMIEVNPLKIKEMPVVFGDFSQVIGMLGLGVVSNSELSTTYSVRGGSFDENLVYINNIEIYRPFLVRAGQQEGLSFVNPDLVRSVEFSAGGWQPKYGDKLSSVLNIEYKNPKEFHASASAGLLGGTAHVEGASRNQRFSYLAGIRYKSGRYLFNTLETKGQYFPNFVDFQGFFNFDLSSARQKERGLKTNLSFLVSYAQNRYQVVPQSRESTFGTFNRVLRLYVAFQGQEILNYDTWQTGFKLSHQFSQKFQSHLIGSLLNTKEREYINTEGGYRLCDVEMASDSPAFNRCAYIRGVGNLFTYARNSLNANILAFENRNEFTPNADHRIEFGIRFSGENIRDDLAEYNFTDSADYVNITDRLFIQNQLVSQRLMGYAQHTWYLSDNHILTYGFRLNYWNINKELLFSPRLQYSFKPEWKKDIRFNFALGMYYQPPFYREMRDFEGNLNRNLKAQRAVHAIAGMDYAFRAWGRPFRFISEVYYKPLQNLVPYDMDNVRLRYYANNQALGYVTGADFRISGEFIPDTESWFSLSLMRARENWTNDQAGEFRRPTDQLVTLAVYFEDYIPNNPDIRVNLRAMYGSGLPFNPPNNPKYRGAFSGADYRRIDIGFSKIFDLEKDKKSEKKAFKNKFSPKSVWVGLEILNLAGTENTISYLWIKDFADTNYAVPNGLSQRFFNLRTVARW